MDLFAVYKQLERCQAGVPAKTRVWATAPRLGQEEAAMAVEARIAIKEAEEQLARDNPAKVRFCGRGREGAK